MKGTGRPVYGVTRIRHHRGQGVASYRGIEIEDLQSGINYSFMKSENHRKEKEKIAQEEEGVREKGFCYYCFWIKRI